MREIKFRGWNQYTKEMDYDVCIDGGRIVHFGHGEATGSYDLEDFTPMQYTGKKDSNDIEIYEGDILKCESMRIIGNEIRVVCWDSYQAKYKSVPLSTYHANAGNGGWTGYDLYRTKCEVIGNIYENPELLTP